ncbi:MAG: ABC transporter permease [Planctomycetes bacterium]|nr:ABC transporter permease [Planctomycetota bacterium]
MGSGFVAIATKECLHVLRDPSTRFVFLIPILQLVLFGYAIRIDIEDVPTAIVDLDRTQDSREALDRFRNARTFEVVRELGSVAEIEDAIVAGDVKVGICAPLGFARKLARGEEAELLVVVDGSYSSEASAAINVSRELALWSSQTLRAVPWDVHELKRVPRAVPLARVAAKPRLLFNPNLESANFFVPGLVGIVLQLVTVLLTAFSIVRERENGTFEQLMVTPVGVWGLLLGKLAPYAVIAVLETAFVINVMVFVFGVPIAGSLPLLGSLTLLFLLTSLSIGVIISTVARNQAEAMQMAFLLLLPSILLSGFVFPLESMPRPIYPVTFLIPVRYFIEILRGIILRDAPFSALVFPTASLAIFTALLLIVSALRFRRRVA